MSAPENEVVSNAELEELFRVRRPDAAAFRERVARKIMERGREEDPGESAQRPGLRADIVRRAAAFLPLDPSGASGIAKLVLTSFVLPIIVLVATIAAFVSAGRAVRDSALSASPAAAEPDLSDAAAYESRPRLRRSTELAGWVYAAALLVLMLPGITGAAWAADLVVALVLFAALALVFVVRGLAEAALLTPRTVAGWAGTILFGLIAGVFLFSSSRHTLQSASDLGVGWCAVTLFAGILVCAWLTRGARRWVQLALACFAIVLNPIGLTFSSEADVAQQAVELDVHANDLRGWKSVAAVLDALPPGETRNRVVSAVEREIEGALRAAPGVHPQVWTTALHAGVMTHERWMRLAAWPEQRYRLDQLLVIAASTEKPPSIVDYDEYLVPMLVATRDLTAQQRELLVRRVDASWPASEAFEPLGLALSCVRLFDHLGAPERAAARRSETFALLESHWFPGGPFLRYAQRGGFTPDPTRFETSLSGSTQAAVSLMVRFGVPESIDVRAVRHYLRGKSEAYFLMPFARRLEDPYGDQLATRAALVRLEREVGLPPRSFLAALAGERMFIACLLLVLLCLVAITSAPRPDAASALGALP